MRVRDDTHEYITNTFTSPEFSLWSNSWGGLAAVDMIQQRRTAARSALRTIEAKQTARRSWFDHNRRLASLEKRGSSTQSCRTPRSKVDRFRTGRQCEPLFGVTLPFWVLRPSATYTQHT